MQEAPLPDQSSSASLPAPFACAQEKVAAKHSTVLHPVSPQLSLLQALSAPVLAAERKGRPTERNTNVCPVPAAVTVVPVVTQSIDLLASPQLRDKVNSKKSTTS